MKTKQYKLIKEINNLDGSKFLPQVLEVSKDKTYYIRSTRGDMLAVNNWELKDVEKFEEVR